MLSSVQIRRIWKLACAGLLWISFITRFTVGTEVFHGVEKALSLLRKNNQTTCLATEALRLNNPHRNVYPLDLFGQKVFPSDNYSCFFLNPILRQETHSCSHSHNICPIKEEYLRIAMTGFENASSQICHTFKSLKDPNEPIHPPVNVILIGASVTGGVASGGCTKGFCSTEENAPCVQFDCAWPNSVLTYLRNRFEKKNKNKKKINLIDLAAGATTSCTLLHTLVQKLEAKNVTLSSRDLLFYDYSVNDGIVFQDPKQLQALRHCIEGVLEKLVHYSTDGLPPTIILLEFYPFKGFTVVQQQPSTEMQSYSTVYHEVARKFHLPIISYRDLHWHPLFREDVRKFSSLEYIVNYKWAKPTVPGGYWVDTHPPWIAHDLFADVIAGVLEVTHHLCNHDNTNFNNNNKNNNNKNSGAVDQLLITNISFDPWKSFRDGLQTSHNLKVLINEEATVANAPFLPPEEIRALPYEWKLYQDRRGKPGWIVEQPADANAERHRNKAELTFSAPYNTTSSSSSSFFFSSSAASSSPATLEITYMQTYRNAGAFHVKVCDVFVPTWPDNSLAVDTLIREAFTSLDTAIFKVDLNSVVKRKICQRNGGLVVVKIYHEYLGDQLEARGAQKVKITSVRLTVAKEESMNGKSDIGMAALSPWHCFLIVIVVGSIALVFRRLSASSFVNRFLVDLRGNDRHDV
jgi:hypothetical protein